MSTRSTTDMIRHLVCTAHKVRHASTTSLPRPKRVRPEHGQQIFVFNHLQTNQVVYSLTKLMKNNDALRQLPFNGKKTVPRAIRKDLWSPLATISFPPGQGPLGLSAFQKLRELRRLHETHWDPSTMVEAIEYNDGSVKIETLSRKGRGRKLMDQKANSVADIAHVLGAIGTAHGDSVGLVEGEKRGFWKEQKVLDEGGKPRVKKIFVPHPEAGKVLVEVRWRDLLDAEFARSWKGNVVHDVLEAGGLDMTYGEAIEAAEEAKRREEEEKKRLEALEKEGNKEQQATV